eukprot:6187637-Pleurochrysis_carterae.AAC.4
MSFCLLVSAKQGCVSFDSELILKTSRRQFDACGTTGTDTTTSAGCPPLVQICTCLENESTEHTTIDSLKSGVDSQAETHREHILSRDHLLVGLLLALEHGAIYRA